MKLSSRLFTALAALGGASTLLLGHQSAHSQTSPKVVASYSVLCDLTQQIAQDTADVTCLIEAGKDPHLYSATPADRRAIETADLVLYGGYGFEPDIIQMVEATDGDTPEIAVSELAVSEPLLGGHHDHGHGEEDHDDHGEEGHDDHGEEDHDDHDEEGHDDHGHDDHSKAGHEGHDHGEEGHDDHGKEDHDDHGEEDHDDHGEEGHDDQRKAGHEGQDHGEDGHDDQGKVEHEDHGEEDQEEMSRRAIAERAGRGDRASRQGGRERDAAGHVLDPVRHRQAARHHRRERRVRGLDRGQLRRRPGLGRCRRDDRVGRRL